MKVPRLLPCLLLTVVALRASTPGNASVADTPPAPSVLAAAQAAFRDGDLDGAARLLEPAVVPETADPAALVLMSQIQAARKDGARAVALAERAVAAAPDRIEAHAALGRACSVRISQVPFLQQPMIALKMKRAFERCVELDPRSIDGLIGLSRYYSSAPEIAGGSLVRAREFAVRLTEALPFLGELELGRIAEQAGDRTAALAHYEAALRHHPTHAGARAARDRLAAPAAP
jgi:tetratricopeptide (TPR) repeat protein